MQITTPRPLKWDRDLCVDYHLWTNHPTDLTTVSTSIIMICSRRRLVFGGGITSLAQSYQVLGGYAEKKQKSACVPTVVHHH